MSDKGNLAAQRGNDGIVSLEDEDALDAIWERISQGKHPHPEKQSHTWHAHPVEESELGIDLAALLGESEDADFRLPPLSVALREDESTGELQAMLVRMADEHAFLMTRLVDMATGA